MSNKFKIGDKITVDISDTVGEIYAIADESGKKIYSVISDETGSTLECTEDRLKHAEIKKHNEGELYQEYLLKIEVFDASGKSLGIEYAVGERRKGKFEVSLPSVFDYPANYFEGSYKVLSHSIINQ